MSGRCAICKSPDRLLIEAWIRKRTPSREVVRRMGERGVKMFLSTLSTHTHHAGLELVEECQLR